MQEKQKVKENYDMLKMKDKENILNQRVKNDTF
jgi:hypothetical protein